MKSKQKYWYVTTIDMCVVCGREIKSRVRVYTKPKYNIKVVDFACHEHFI